MDIHDITPEGYEKVIKAFDAETGLTAFIAIHNTTLGPAVGGTRLYPYTSEEDALTDVLRLSRGMTYKSALAGIDFGGGKSVIIARPQDKTDDLLRAFGRAVDSLGGQYKCAEDVNTSVDDMEIIRQVTPHVSGLAKDGGDPSPITALGVFSALRVTMEENLGIHLENSHIALQGVGHVGTYLVRHLRAAGARVTIADVRSENVNALAAETGAHVGDPHTIHTLECDIFSPCAMGAILNEKTIPELQCKAVVGAANNQLATPEDAERLHTRGILYAPDYLVNAGGIINVFIEQRPKGYNSEEAHTRARAIGDTLREIYTLAQKEDISPAKAADRVAEKRFS